MTKKGRWVLGGVAAAAVLAAGGGVLVYKGQGAPGAKAAVTADGKTAGKDGKKPEVALQFAPREVVQPLKQRMAAVLEFSGALVAPNTAVVRARAGGTLLTAEAAEGSRVRAGQTLARLDLAELDRRVAERDAMLASARASLEQAERVHASNERLAQQSFISPNALENSRAAVETARAALQAAQASRDAARVGLRDATLAAPIAGIVAKRHALPGEKVSPEQPLFTLVDLSRLELAGLVPMHEVSRLRPGMAVKLQVEGLDEAVTGTLARIAPAAEPGTRSIGVTIVLDNPGERLRAGQYAMAQVTLADDSERLTLPMTAVGQAAGQDHVWLIEGGVLARRAVTLGRRSARAGVVEVLEGVSPDSQVLAARFDNLREGAKASVVAPKAPALASASGPAAR